jgi:hypothetical protein
MTTTHVQEAPVTTADGRPVDAAPATGVSRWRDIAVGAAVEAGETTAGMIGDVRRTVARRRQWFGDLAERGSREQERIRRRAAAATGSAVSAVATSSLIDRVVDAQLERVLRPVVRAVLDDVLMLLEHEPDRIQSLIRGQRESMVDEVVGRIRAGAATGDTAVERLTVRMFRRDPRPAAAPPPADGT